MRQKLPICRCGAVRRLSFPSSSVLEVSQLCNKCELFSEPQDPFLQLVPKSRSAQLPRLLVDQEVSPISRPAPGTDSALVVGVSFLTLW